MLTAAFPSQPHPAQNRAFRVFPNETEQHSKCRIHFGASRDCMAPRRLRLPCVSLKVWLLDFGRQAQPRASRQRKTFGICLKNIVERLVDCSTIVRDARPISRFPLRKTNACSIPNVCVFKVGILYSDYTVTYRELG